MKTMKLGALALLSMSAIASFADPVVDGTIDSSYGLAKSVQDTATGFGNSTLGLSNYANGSELDAAYAWISGGNLYLGFAGNLESNFNKLEVFIDSKAGGQNVLRGDNPDVDFNGLNRMSGMKFDAGFSPDYWISMTCGGGTFGIYNNYSELNTGGGGSGYYMGSSVDGNGNLSGGSNPFGIQATLNNSNTGGVDGGSSANGAFVTTGMEYCIPLTAIGSPGGEIRISAMINGGGHDYMSNQVLGGTAGAGNLGEPHNVDFTQLSGNQYFAVPEPGSILAIGLGLGAILLRRRKG